MTRFALCAILAFLAACSRTDTAPAAPGPGVAVTDAWARATAPGQSGAIYATIVNKGGDERLVGVESAQGRAMLHVNKTSDGVARMRGVDEVAIPRASQVALAPGGAHVMLTRLGAPLSVGGKLSVTFRFAAAGPRTVKVAIVAPGAR